LAGWIAAWCVAACGSGGDAGPSSGDAMTAGAGGGSAGASSQSPGTLPNLGTDPNDDPAPEPAAEPADCEELPLGACVTAALDELSGCHAAGHGGTFAADTSRCDLPEADAVVTFTSAVPRWSTAFALGFALDVAGQRCASYAERPRGEGVAAGIDLATAQHQVKLETASDSTRTLTCDGEAVSFQQANLARCQDSQRMPTPELMDQTLDGVYRVSPMLQSDRSIFNCQFAASSP
jgi:hypothetical protein